MNTVSRNMRAPALIKAVERFATSEGSVTARIKAVYTRQDEGEWTFLMGRCVVGVTGEEADSEDIYRNFAFATS